MRVTGQEARRVLRELMPPLYVPAHLYEMVGPPSRVYYRVHRRGDEYAVLLVYEWPDQMVPPHRYDYEPVVIIGRLRGGRLRVAEIYTDGFHYFVERHRPLSSNSRPLLVVDAPWRSMDVLWVDDDTKPRFIQIYPVDERGRVPLPEPEPLTAARLGELRRRRENPLSISPTIIEDPFSVRGAAHWQTYGPPSLDDIVRDLAKNYGLRVGLGPVRRLLRDMIAVLAERVGRALPRLRGRSPRTRRSRLLAETA